MSGIHNEITPGVGFTPGRPFTRADHVTNKAMDMTAHPWTENGYDRTLELTNFPEYLKLFRRRYGASTDQDLPDVNGQHDTDYIGDLRDIADLDPDWFERTGNGLHIRGHHSNVPTMEERMDAYYSASGAEVQAHAAELRKASLPATPSTPPPIPPVKPTTPSTPSNQPIANPPSNLPSNPPINTPINLITPALDTFISTTNTSLKEILTLLHKSLDNLILAERQSWVDALTPIISSLKERRPAIAKQLQEVVDQKTKE